jgi:xylulokinase
MAYLGLDLSSQSLSALIIDAEAGTILKEYSVSFGKDLPQYETQNGFVCGDNQQVYSYPAMFLDALELLFSELSEYLPQIQAVSLSGQQHASVYLNDSFESVLTDLDQKFPLSSQLVKTLSRSITPIWMDHSTSLECEEMASSVGDAVIEISGSPYCERFTAAQIRKFAKNEPEAYDQTDKIHLVSSFMTSVLIGSHAAIDTSDGAGMNLMNLATGEWDDNLLSACVMGLRSKFPKLEVASKEAGTISSFFQEKFGFSENCAVINASGDNPNSLIGCGAVKPGTAVISLGTSDTFFSASGSSPIDTKGVGHVFGNPAGGFMSLICFRNGSLSREEVLNHYGLSWDQAEKMMTQTAPSPLDILPFLLEEMYPAVKATTKISDFSKWSAAEGLTALIEGQFLNLRLQSQSHLLKVDLIRLTGGASRNKAIAQIVANIFDAKVECIQSSSSASLGAAMRACEAFSSIEWDELIAKFSQASQTYLPENEKVSSYQIKLTKFSDLLNSSALV